MIRWREGVVTGIVREWAGAVELRADTGSGGADPDVVPALAYPDLVGRPRVGDRVLLNTTALNLELGTGGHALVLAVLGRLPPDPAGPGHIVKVRYTPVQVTVLTADEQGSPHHDLLADADDLGGLPVVVADLHSALPAVVAAVHADRPGTRVAYVMTDGGALPMWYSQTVAALCDAGELIGTVTVGQAFGGDLEAVNVHTGLLAARHVLDADIAVVTQGPGNLGTDTRWGFSGTAAGEAVNAVAALGGRPVASLRISGADPRERHRGVSHHSRTAYGRVALVPADVVLPRLDEPLAGLVAGHVDALRDRHRVVTVDADDLLPALAGGPVRLSTMGRGLADDPAYFLSAAAAGRHAARLLG